MKIFRKALPFLILAAAVLGFLVLRATGPTAPVPETSERVWQVRGVSVERGVFQPTLELYGRTSSPDEAVLRTAVDGDVQAVPARAGLVVEAGSLLVRIDPSETRLLLDQREAELREAEAAIESERLRAEADRRTLQREQALLQIAQRGLDRARDLRTRNLGSDAEVDQAQRTLEQARLAVDAREQAVADAPSRMAQAEARRERARAAAERGRLDLDRTQVRASVPARIVEIHVSPGERVRPGESLLRLYPLGDLEIRASVPEWVLSRLSKLLEQGYPLKAEAEVAGQTIRAELDRLAAETRPGEAGISALFRITEGAANLPLNRFVNLRLSLPQEADSVAVPFEALYGRDRIYRIADGRLQGLRVERLGEISDADGHTLALIRHPDLQTGDVLVATRLPNAVDGLRVEAQMTTVSPPR